MTLASGADVSIGGVEYNLAPQDFTVSLSFRRHPYVHRFSSLFSNSTAIAGEIAKQQLRPEKMLWSLTDFSGGEGSPIYYPQNPTSYDIGSLANISNAGLLTSRTRRRVTSVARSGGISTTAMRPAGGSTWDKAVIAWGDNGLFSTTGLSWTAGTQPSPETHFFGGNSDGRYMVFGTLAESTSNVVLAVDGSLAIPTYADLFTGTTAINSPFVTEVLDGVWYSWGLDGAATPANSLALLKGAGLSASTGSPSLIFSSGLVPSGTWGTDFWTDLEAGQGKLFFSFATPAGSIVYVSESDVGRTFFTSEPGFVIKKLVYKLGVLFLLGAQVSAGKQFASVYAIPLSTESPINIGSPRKHKNTELAGWEVGCAGPDSNLFLADADSGKIFLYDMERDAFSLFDDLVNGGTGDGLSFSVGTSKLAFLAPHGSRIFGATWAPTGVGTSLQVITYDDLVKENRDASQSITFSLESGEWDYGVPQELKALIGFYVTYEVTDSTTASGLVANSRITVSYATDSAISATPAYTALTTITSSTAVIQKGRHFIPISDADTTVKFSRLKIKITGDNNAHAVAPPIIYSVVAEAQLMAYTETWELILQVQDEEPGSDRPRSRQQNASELRDNLLDLAINKQVVEFLDGTRYGERQGTKYTTHTVTVEDPSDFIEDNAEGFMNLTLRSVPV